MSWLEYSVKSAPTGWRKIFYINWPLVILICSVAGIGFVMLYSVAGGRMGVWAEPQMKRFALGLFVMFFVAMVPLWFWRSMSLLAYAGALALLLMVEFFGAQGGGAQRWIELGPLRLQPSELMKITLVMFLAAYYDWLPNSKVSHPLWVIVPVLIILAPAMLTLLQPDLGTALLLMVAGALVMFLAGVHWGYFTTVAGAGIGLVWAVFASRGTDWQLIKDYQFRRIDIFLDPSA